MSGTHDILAAERAAAAKLHKDDNQGIWNDRSEGTQAPSAPINFDKDPSSGIGNPNWTEKSTLGGATSADVHQGIGHPGPGMSSKEVRHDGRPGRKTETQIHMQGSKPSDVEEI